MIRVSFTILGFHFSVDIDIHVKYILCYKFLVVFTFFQGSRGSPGPSGPLGAPGERVSNFLFKLLYCFLFQRAS